MIKIFLPLLVSLSGVCLQSQAQGDLLVTPARVVFEGNKQKETLDLVNMGKDTATYSISFVQKNMKEDGSFVNIEKPDSGQLFADPYLRVFPRTVKLAPGEPQTVMLQFRRKADMIAGEYRSHLYFRSEKNYKPLGTKSGTDTTLLSVQLIPIFGITIPVIIRTGTVQVNAVLSDFNLDNRSENPTMKIAINRTGNISIYGDIIVDFIPSQGKSFEIGIVKGVGVYSNLNKRYITVKLNNTSGKPLTDGKLKVRYMSSGESKQVVYAQGEMEIN